MTTEDNNLHKADGNQHQKTENNFELPHSSENSRDSNELNTSKDEYEEVPLRDYSSMNLESLYSEINHLLSHYPVNRISKAVNIIKREFNKKHKKEEEKKKDAFVEEGGNPNDFHFKSAEKEKFNHVLSEYKKQLSAFYKNLEQQQKQNLEKRHSLIDALKKLYQEPNDNNASLFSEFRRIRSEWHDAGRVPANSASDVFRTYYHHLDNFYEYLNLNKELQQLDFEHNLQKRYSIIERAQSLLEEDNIRKALNELQYLHKLWKEEAVPVAEEHREPTWNTFKDITHQIHDKKQEYFQQQKEKEVENQKIKEDVISELKNINESIEDNHKYFQNTIKVVEELRKNFMKTGRAPRSINQHLWDDFKDNLRSFNRRKNKFYKEMKGQQGENLAKKENLVKLANENKHREDWEEAVHFFKNIQKEWKNVGMVPKKQSNAVWKEFNAACNEFFQRFKNRNQKNLEELNENLESKKQFLKELDNVSFEGLEEEDVLKKATEVNKKWNKLGEVPRGEQEIEQKFKNELNSLLKEANENVDLSTIKRKIKVNQMKQSGDEDQRNMALRKIRSQMDEIRNELSKLENNLSFFGNADKNNPLLKNVHKDIQHKNEALDLLKKEYDSLKNISFDVPEEEENEQDTSEE